MIAQVSFSHPIKLGSGSEQIITFFQEEPTKHHTKKEYIKILENKLYQVHYNVKWKYLQETTQPLQVTLYKVSTDFEFISLHQHVTVCTGAQVNLKKKFEFHLKTKERICLGVKNLSTVDFEIAEANLSLT